MQNSKCVICNCIDILPICLNFKRNDDVMCFSDLKDLLVICTCNKKINEAPTKLCVLFPFNDNSEKIYYDISEDLNILRPFLEKYNKTHYTLECCRGCQYRIDK